jgi:cell division protein FtsQ
MKKKQISTKSAHSLAQKRKFRIYFFNFKLLVKWLLAISVLITIYKNTHHALNYVQSAFVELSAACGFKLNNIIIQGQKNFDIKDFLSQLNADNNTPILSIDLTETKQFVENNDWIKEAIIYRKLPNTLQIKVIERIPIALWQYNKQVFLIDEEGYAMKGDLAQFDHLPYFIGEGANVYAASIIKILDKKQALFRNIQYIIRLGNRRWDFILEDDFTVKMPEDNFEQAIEYLNTQCLDYLSAKYMQNTLDKIKTLDLRDNQKYYIEKHPQ